MQLEPKDGAIAAAKAALRVAARAQLKTITAEQRLLNSVQVCERLVQQPVWQGARTLLCYAPRPDELDIAAVVEKALADGKVVTLPQFDPHARAYRACQIALPIQQIPVGTFGLREPGRHSPSWPLNQLDMILVPGLAFDLNGCRLGRGKAFYDRLLTGVPGVKCGVAFDEQIRPQIPVESHDVVLDCILTPTRWVEVRAGRFGDDLVG
jgi:5-formyltetrahydrofolate cyclo-ligase